MVLLEGKADLPLPDTLVGPGPSGGMADATDSKSVVRKDVWVRVPPRAPRPSIHSVCMGQRLLHRRLAQVSARMLELRSELLVVADQLSHVTDDANDKSLRALVAETPSAQFEYREAQRHADAMKRHHDQILAELSGLDHKMNELLDRMKESTS
jgi:hypothetical protein